jgi:hypothetical protein
MFAGLESLFCPFCALWLNESSQGSCLSVSLVVRDLSLELRIAHFVALASWTCCHGSSHKQPKLVLFPWHSKYSRFAKVLFSFNLDIALLVSIWTSFLASFILGAIQQEIFEQNCELQTFFRETVEGRED